MVLQGNLELIEEEVEDDHIRTFATDAAAACIRASTLTEQLLTFSKGGAPLREPHSLARVIEQSCLLAGSGANVSLDQDLWPVEINPGQIGQVISNLLINAIQAMPGGGTVRIRARNEEITDGFPDPGRWVVAEVEDFGEGIRRENLHRIYDPYFSTKAGGSGLGLAIAHSIIHNHEGHLTAESTPGEGSLFRIHLPATSETPLAGITGTTHSPVSSKKVLVMDDDAAVRRVMTRLLEFLGHRCETAATGEEAVEDYRLAMERGEPYALVIMDLVVVGGMGGKDAVHLLRQVDPGARVVVASGYSSDLVLSEYRRYGFDAALEKPMTTEALSAVLNKLFG